MKNEINKIAIARSVMSTLVVVELNGVKKFEKTRKEVVDMIYDGLIAGGVDKHDVKPNLCPSYYQMISMKMLKGQSEYKHHKGRKAPKQAELFGEEVVLAVVIPEGSEFTAVKGDVTEYFKNRQAAQAYVKKNGPKEDWKIEKIA